MSKDFTRAIFEWLEAQAADPDVASADFRSGFSVSRNFSRKHYLETGELRAWNYQDQMAKAAAIPIRSFQRCISNLRASGYLAITEGKGRGHSSTYEARIPPAREKENTSSATPFSDENTSEMTPFRNEKTRQIVQENTSNRAEKAATVGGPYKENSLNNSLSNSLNRAREEASLFSSREKTDASVKKSSPRPNKKSEIEALFEARFWPRWPHKVGKPYALKAFEKCWREIDAIEAGIDRYIATKPPDRNWLNPATFLNQRRWEDQPAQQAVNGFANGGASPARRARPTIWEISGLADPYHKNGGR